MYEIGIKVILYWVLPSAAPVLLLLFCDVRNTKRISQAAVAEQPSDVCGICGCSTCKRVLERCRRLPWTSFAEEGPATGR